MTNPIDLWTRMLTGDLRGFEDALGEESSVTLAGSGRILTGSEAQAAYRNVSQRMPTLSVTAKVDRCEDAIVVWVNIHKLPWLPEEAVRSVLRISGRSIEVLGGLEQLLEQELPPQDANSRAIAPSALHPNALILRAGYDDPSIHATILADGFVAHTPGQNPIAGDWKGAVPMAEHLSRIRRLSGDTMKVRPLTRLALANDDFGVVFSRATAARGAHGLDQYVCGVWRFEHGRIAEHWELVSDPHAWDAFWNADDSSQ
jgi:hypothetical protein